MLKPHFDAHLECMRRDLGTTLWLRDLIHRELQAGNLPSLSGAAARLNISPRTLTARLAEDHTSYRGIVDSVRSLHDKLGVRQQGQLVRRILQVTLISPQPPRLHGP